MISKADDKYTFLAFCFEYEKLMDFMSNSISNVFHTYLPIQLDATCNGYQHMALLTKGSKALAKLNLTKARVDTVPKDLYQMLVL